nr:bifunctional fucokinase/fucose pyrophosphorylase [Tanacetum cinerariifolium]
MKWPSGKALDLLTRGQGFNTSPGGLFIMTGDVLPCFDASVMVFPEDTSCIITVTITLDIASNHEDEYEGEPMTAQKALSFVQTTKHVKAPRPYDKTVEHPIPAANLKPDIPKPKGHRNNKNRKACFVCKSLTNLIKDYDYYEKKMVQKPVKNHAQRGNHQHYARLTHPNPHRHVVPTSVLTRYTFGGVKVKNDHEDTLVRPRTSESKDSPFLGGLFIMTGDVLPCFDASAMVLPEDTSCIITVPITLDIASNHDLVAAWVPAKHDWLRSRPLGKQLVRSLGKQTMYSYCAYDLLFLHFGTSSEVLDHLSGTGSRIVGRRHLCSIHATIMSDIAASAVIVSSKISPGVSTGEDSLVYDSSISDRIQIGSLSIVVGVTIPEKYNKTTNDPYTFLLPDRHCLWEVSLTGSTERVLVYCGLHDNPKITVSKDGTKIARACLTYGLLGRNLSQLCQEISQMEDSGEKICAEHC